MTDPTPAPALTDEQIANTTYTLREHTEHCGTCWVDEAEFDAWYAAVVARAKREAAEEIADELNRRAMRADIDRLPGLAATYRGLIPTVRRIGPTR